MKRRMLTISAAALALGVMNVPSALAQEADAGAIETLFSESCATCHGPAARGMASFPSLRGKEASYLAERLNQYRAGEKVGPNSLLMIPVAADLTDDEIEGLAEYIATAFN